MHALAHNLAQQAKSMKDTKYIPMPRNYVNLIINNHYVHANIAKIAKKCFHSINARYFLQSKYNWNDNTIENIWWNTHAKALRKLSYHDRTRIQKFIHNHCSTNHRDHTYYKYKPDLCNTCFQSTETEDHILQCKVIQRRKLRKSWIKSLMDLDKNKIPLEVRKAMCLGLQRWLNRSSANIDNILSTFSTNIQLAFQHQSEIGWDHFARGRISLTWGTLINEIFAKENFDAEAWGTKIIDINFEHLLSFWEHRCQKEYGIKKEEQESKLKQRLLNDVIHMQQTSIPRNDNDAKILHYDFEELRKLDHKQLQDWMVGARIIYKLCKTKINNSPNYFTDAAMCQELEVDPG